MFDFVRKHTKIMMSVMFLLIIPSFVLFGIDGYNRYQDDGKAVAMVNGHEITQSEWDNAHKLEADRLRKSMPNADAKLLDSPEARYATLERLIRERVLAAAVETFNLTISDASLARALQEDPTIASLRQPDGKLDMERYRQLAASQGLTPEGFEARVRHDLSLRQVESIITDTSFATPAVANVALNAFFDKREVQIAKFSTADFSAKVTPSEAELDAFYKANQALFQAPEQANIEYVTLNQEVIKKSIVINEADLKTYYEQNVARLSGNEERRASHILINASKDAPAAERQKAKTRADELLQAARQAPDSFAELAKKNSQDTGSSVKGGDLDFFARGAMVKPFEEAVFKMKKGDISDVVESDFGYHIIKLTDVKTPKQRSFEELRASLEADLKSQQAQRKFAEIAEIFTNGVYEQSEGLKPIADKLKLEIQTATNLTRKPAAASTGVLSNEKFLAALFSADAIEKKRNTEVIELGANQLVAGRIAQYTPARTLPFAEVRNVVRDRVVASNAAQLAQKEGLAKLAAWKAAPATATMPAPMPISREQSQNMPAQILNAALRADTSTLPMFVGVDLGAQGYAVVRVNKVLPRVVATEAVAKQEQAQYAKWWADAESDAYYNYLKDRFKVVTTVARPTTQPRPSDPN